MPPPASRVEEPSQLPAEILKAAEDIVAGLDTLEQWLRIVRDSQTPEAAYRALDHAEHENGRLLETARRLRVTIKVAQMPAIAVVAPTVMKGERPETTRALELFDPKMRQANDHSLDREVGR